MYPVRLYFVYVSGHRQGVPCLSVLCVRTVLWADIVRVYPVCLYFVYVQYCEWTSSGCTLSVCTLCTYSIVSGRRQGVPCLSVLCVRTVCKRTSSGLPCLSVCTLVCTVCEQILSGSTLSVCTSCMCMRVYFKDVSSHM